MCKTHLLHYFILVEIQGYMKFSVKLDGKSPKGFLYITIMLCINKDTL